jgi:hypothetical protein
LADIPPGRLSVHDRSPATHCWPERFGPEDVIQATSATAHVDCVFSDEEHGLPWRFGADIRMRWSRRRLALGGRTRVADEHSPKEILPVGDKPVLEHMIRELVDSGIVDITIVTSTRMAVIQSHFAPDRDLEHQLEQAGKIEPARSIRELSALARITYLYQEGPYGKRDPNRQRIPDCQLACGQSPDGGEEIGVS